MKLSIRKTNISFSECDTVEEVCKIANDLYCIARAQDARIEELESKGKDKGHKGRFGKAAGLILLFILLFGSIAHGAIPWRWEYANDADWMDRFMRAPQWPGALTLANGLTIENSTNNVLEINENSEDLLLTFSSNTIAATSTTGLVLFNWGAVVPAANQMLFNPVTAAVGTVEGTVYYDSDDDNLYVRTTAGLVDLTAGGAGNTLDSAYDQGGAGAGRTINADTGAVAITVAAQSNNNALIITQSDTNDLDTLQIINAGSGATAVSIDIDGQATGRDIEGTAAAWFVDGAGAATFGTLSTTTTAGIGTDLTVTGNTVLNGDTDIGNAVTDTVTITGYINADLSLDDGAGAPPQLIFRDGSDETAAFNKTLTGALTLTTQSDDGLNIAVGNLRVGNGTPGTAPMDGEDAYFEGQVEFDSQVTHDAVTVMNEWLDLNEELDIDMDAADETVEITTSATTYTADSAVVAITASGAGATNNTYLLRLRQNAANDAQDHYLILENNNGDDLFQINANGTTQWDLEAAGTVRINGDTAANTSTTGVLQLDVQSATNGNIGMLLTYQQETGATQATGIKIDLNDDTAGAEFFDGINIANSAGTNATARGLVLANTLDTSIVSAQAAGAAFATIDAATIDSTLATGVIDLDWDSLTASSEAVNIKATHLTGGSGQTISAMEIELDADSGNASDTLRGIYINASDVTATGFIDGIHIGGLTGIRAAIQTDFGYVRIGTGSAPDITPGDDDLFVEGTLEVDGATRFDSGTITLANGISIETTTNERIEFRDTESFGINLSDGANQIEFTTDTGVNTIDFNDLDALIGLGALTGDFGQLIDFSTNELIEFGDTEKLGLIFSGTNIIELGTDTGVTTIDFNDLDNLTDIESIQYDDDTLSKLLVTTVQLTAAEVNDLVGNPKQLVAAPGVDYLIWPIDIVLILDAGTEVLAESADNLVIGWNSAAVQAGETIETTGFIDSAADIITNWHMAKDEINAAAGVVNKNLSIKNDSGDFTGNTSRDAAMTITVYYRIIKVGL